MKLLNALRLFYIRNMIKNENRIKVLFDHHFFTNQYFLHKSASEAHMANILNIECQVLNQITVKNYDLNFNYSTYNLPIIFGKCPGYVQM